MLRPFLHTPHSTLHTLPYPLLPILFPECRTLLTQFRDLLFERRDLRFHLRVDQLMLDVPDFAFGDLRFAPGVDDSFLFRCHGFLVFSCELFVVSCSL